MPSNKEFQGAAIDNLIASNNDTTILAIKNHNSGNDITYKKSNLSILMSKIHS